MRLATCLVAVLVAAGTARAQEIDWKANLESGLQEARRSGQAVFLVTRWKDGV